MIISKVSFYPISVFALFASFSLQATAGSTTAQTPAQAFADGSSSASTFNSNTNGNISQSNVNSLPGYQGTPSNASTLYSNGSGNVTSAGTSQVSACASANTSGVSGQYCNATNFTVSNEPQNVTTAPQNLTNDPLVVNSSTLAKTQNATITAAGSTDAGITSALSQLGINTSTTTSSCSTTTNTIPATYTYKTCTIVNPMAPAQCSTGRIINIQTNTNYQCNQNQSQYVNQTCPKTLNVQINQGACTATAGKAWLPRSPTNNTPTNSSGYISEFMSSGSSTNTDPGTDSVAIDIGCSTPSNGNIPVTIYASDNSGITSSVSTNLPTNVSTAATTFDAGLNKNSILLGQLTSNWYYNPVTINVFVDPSSPGCNTNGSCTYNIYYYGYAIYMWDSSGGSYQVAGSMPSTLQQQPSSSVVIENTASITETVSITDGCTALEALTQ